MHRKYFLRFLVLSSTLLFNFEQRVAATDSTWTGATSAWDLNTNWSPTTVPDGIASFTGTLPPSSNVDIDTDESIDRIQFTVTPRSYLLNILGNNSNAGSLTISTGVDNTALGISAVVQELNAKQQAQINFTSSASADIGSTGKVKYVIDSDTIAKPSILQFSNSSTAGAAIIDLGIGSTAPAQCIFTDTSTAATSTITAENGAIIQFIGSSTPGGATIDLDSSQILISRTSASSINSTAKVALSNGSILTQSANTTSLVLSKLTSASSTDFITIGGASLAVGDSSTGGQINGQISGAGIFAYVGTGDLELVNTSNNYAGGTLVQSGKLIADIDALPTTGVVQTQANGIINIKSNTAFTFAGNFQNFGEILYTGSGDTTLTGNILQNGDLVVSAGASGSLILTSSTINLGSAQVTGGTLSIPFASCPDTSVSSGAFLILTGAGGTSTSALTNNGTVTYEGTGVGTLESPGAITGTGNLVVNATGSGQLILDGTNTYTGTTTVQDGALTVTEGSLPSSNTTTVNPGAFLNFKYETGGTFSGNITNNGVVFSSGAGNTTLTGNISGTGSVQSVTAIPSSMFLRGNNTYSGGTNVLANSELTVHTQSLPTTGVRQINSGGVIVIDNTAADTNYTGTFVDNGTLQISPTANINFAGVISGTGGVNVNAPGKTITFSAADTYTGNTNVTAGKLDIVQSTTNTLPSPLNISSGAQINLDQAASTTGTYSGGLSGSGIFTVNQDGGTGVVSLTGASTFTGTSTVYNGELDATPASLPATVSVNTNALVDIEQATGTGTYAGVISNNGVGQQGAVAINKNGGVGTVKFTGLNTYSGGTTVYNGILQGTTSTLQGNIVVNSGAKVDFEQLTTSGTYSGILSGAGGVKVNAPGQKVTFTGNNTYSGMTDVVAGELVMNRSSTGTLPSLLNIATGATLDLEQVGSTVGTYSGGLSGGGLLTINRYGNTGRVVLTGPSTSTGSAIVYKGELQAFTGSLPLSVAVNTNALLDIEQVAGSGTYAGVISNNGSGSRGAVAINKQGGLGTVILTGLNTYSGGTTVYNGKLQGTTLSLQGNILVNSGALVDFEQTAGKGVYSGEISGAGGVVINSVAGSTGTVEFRGNNSYSGGTLVSRGTLKGDSRSLQGVITDNATLIFDQILNGTFDGSLAGNGIVEKTGDGKLTFNTNSSAFTGTTNIRFGQLALQNTLGGDLNVYAGGIFSGNGTVTGDVTVKFDGIIAPGNSVGTLAVGGDYHQESGGIYLTQFNGFGQSSLIDVQGQATLDPGSRLICETENKDILINSEYTILTADGGRFGQFTDISSTNSLIDPIVTYDSNNAYVKLKIKFNEIAKTYNQQQVANQLNTIPDDPSQPLQEMLQQFASQSIYEARDSLTQMAGIQYSNLLLTAELANRNFIQRLFDPLRSILTANPCAPYAYCTYQPTYDVWASVSGGKSFIHGNSNAPGFRVSEFGISGGIQSTFTRFFTAGAGLYYERDTIAYRSGGSGRNSSLLGAVYALYRPMRFYVLGDLTFGYSNNRVSRTIEVGSIRYKPKSNPKVYQTTAYAEIGTDYGFKKILVQPFLGLELGHYRFNGITEKGGAPLALVVKGKSQNNSYSRLGLHLTSAPIGCGYNMGVDLAWRFRLTSLGNNNRQYFVDFGDSFKIQGTPLQRNSFETVLYFNKEFSNNWEAYLEATGEGWDNSFSYNFIFGLKTTW